MFPTTRLCSLVRNTIKLLGTVLAALAIGATAAAVHHAIGSLLAWRNAVLAACFRVSLLQVWLGLGRMRSGMLACPPACPQSSPIAPLCPQAYGAHVAISVCLAFLATAAVQLYAPKAAGGGVTLVMAYLNGNALEGLFTLPVFGVKAAGTVAAIVASLCLGMEAPMVHMGASLTALFNDGDQRESTGVEFTGREGVRAPATHACAPRPPRPPRSAVVVGRAAALAALATGRARVRRGRRL